MPGTTYKRRLRNNRIGNTYLNKFIYPDNTPFMLNNLNEDFSGKDQLIRIQNYFYKILDLIIQHNNFTTVLSALNQIIDSVKSYVDYYKIIDMIENDLLSIVLNISDSINPGLIKIRIECVKSYIDQLPPKCQNICTVPPMILELIDSITNNVNFSIVRNNISELQNFITEKYGKLEKYNLIQDNLLSIICNIGEGITTGIVETRVEYVRTLISQL